MRIEIYDSSIENNAAHYGYKAANLIYLDEAIREFEASAEAVELHKLYGNVSAVVPGFKPVDATIIESHLNEHTPKWKDLFRKFQDDFEVQGDKTVLGEPAKKSLKELQGVITECFAKHQISQDLFNEFLTKNDLTPNDLVMVRSTGTHEDKADMANPGGNESLPAHANIAEISAALGRVAASYVGEKSLSQRLGVGDTSITEFPVMPGLVQSMILGSSNKQVYSGVVYTNDGSTRMQAAPGHGEYVVNSKGRVDNYYISPEGILYSEVRPKDFRLQPQIMPGSSKVSLEQVDNTAGLKYGSALDEKTILYLNELSKFIEKKYSKRMDIEFVYDPENNKINIVQARAIPEGQRKGLAPSAIAPDFLGKNKSQLNIVDGLQVITPDVNNAAIVTNANQVIICNSIEEALSRYNTKGKDAGIVGVIVQNPAPDTSHEAGVFNGTGIRVMQVKDITAFEKLLESKQPVIIDPQHSKVYQLPKELFNAEGKSTDGIEQALYDDGILAKGIYASPLTSYVTAVKHQFTAEGVRTVLVATEGALQNKTLGKLLAEAKAGDKVATEQLLSLAHSAMSFKQPQEQKDNKNILDKAKKLRANLDTLSAPKIGQSNDELKAALGYNLRLIANSYKENIISEGLFKQAVISGTEVSIFLDKMSKLEGLGKKEQDKVYLEYFNSEKKFYGLTVGEGSLLATSLKAKQYELMAEQLNPEITGDAKIYLVESLKLRDYLISDEQKQNWDKFCAKICTNPENAAVLGGIVNTAIAFNAHEQWINYIFADVNNPANPKETLVKLVKDFNAIDLQKLQNASKLIKSMESQIPEWSDPAKFSKLYRELQSNLKIINENLKWNKEATNLEKVLILEQVNHLTDVMDKSTKSLERSNQYPESMKDDKGSDLQVTRFKDMVTEFYKHMETWLQNGSFPRRILNDHLELLQYFYTKEKRVNKKEFDLSSDFAVSRAVIDFTGTEGSEPKTLEDFFTLIHQNTIIAINNLSQNIASIDKQYPDLLNVLDQAFSKIRGELIITRPTTINEIKYPILKITKNIPLRGHACVAEIKYNIKGDTTTVNFSLLGNNDGERNRLEYITMNNYLELKLAGFSFISPPYLDAKKGIVNFEVKINHKQQIDKLIDIINKSIQISYNLAREVKNPDRHIKDWVENQVRLLDELNKQKPELQKEIDNFKLLPNIDFTYKELQRQYPKGKEFFIKNAPTIQKFFVVGLTPAQLMEINNKNNDLGELLIDNHPRIISLLELKKLTPEDIKKCKAEDIQNLAKGTISVRQLKVTLTTRTPILSSPTSKNPSPLMGKWTAKYQEKSQTPNPNIS